MKTKSIFTSKTFWLNAIALISSILVMVDPTILSLVGISAEKQIQVMASIGAATAILNKILRFMTDSKVELTTQP